MSNKKEQYRAMIGMMIGSSKLKINDIDQRELTKIISECFCDIIDAEKFTSEGPLIITKMNNIFTFPLVLLELEETYFTWKSLRGTDMPFGLN